MKKLLASILVLAFCFCVFAQTNETSSCPTIFVRGPSKISKPNEPEIYTSKIGEDGESFNVTYNWTVFNGEITEGQGTPSVKVSRNDLIKDLTVKLSSLETKFCGIRQSF